MRPQWLPQVRQVNARPAMLQYRPLLSNESSRAARPVRTSSPPRPLLPTTNTTRRWHCADFPRPENAVASFFTPMSQKPKDKTVWAERGPDDKTPATLLIGRYESSSPAPAGGGDVVDKGKKSRQKIAAFDLDSTLISTSSGKKHASGATDWKWWHDQVPAKLRELYNEQEYQIVIFSNQGGLTLHLDPKSKAPKANAQKRVADFKQKCSAVLNSLDLPTTIYAATGKDIYRKPRTGMWKEFCRDYGIPETEVDMENSIFVGDAGGRVADLGRTSTGMAPVAKDFSCSDRNFAFNVGIDYKTPEEFFLGHKGREFSRDFDVAHFPFEENLLPSSTTTTAIITNPPPVLFEKKNNQDIILFCGPPGAGKSTFFWTHLKPLGYHRINQDLLKTREKCLLAAQDHLRQGHSIAIDNTNADPDTRASWIAVARKFHVPVRCVWFKTPLQICEHNDVVRSLNARMNPETRQGLPKLAFTGFAARYKAPVVKEGFEDVIEVEFKFRGTREEYEIWAKYWI